MEYRASIPPGSQPTTSYWQDPPDVISDLRTTTVLPKHVDIVIVGSGITGATIAYNLLVEQPKLSIVMLEARESASGASGRNGRLGDVGFLG
jgi:ribulose 1,5-bisphosphate synthetase/thiazole synthase